MSSTSRPQDKLNLGPLPPHFPPVQSSSRTPSATTSPLGADVDRNRFAGAFTSMMAPGAGRLGASSPSHEQGRPFSRRAREIQQAETGLVWGPPTASGLSTPLRETIPESPGDDTFPDFNASSLDAPSSLSRHGSMRERRARAGTTPSRFPGLTDPPTSAGQLSRNALSSRVTPTGSPHRSGTTSLAEPEEGVPLGATLNTLARLRAGSTPNRSSLAFSPFGPSIWTSDRPRSSTIGSRNSDDPPVVPAADPLYETDVKTLAFLGLDPSEVAGARGGIATRRPMSSDIFRVNSNRMRSYSTNNKDAYAMEVEAAAAGNSPFGSGTLTPSAQVNAAALAANNAQLRQHNADVQAYIEQLGSNSIPINRPRARTAGLLDSNPARLLRAAAANTQAASRLDAPMNAFDWANDESLDYENLTTAVHALQLQNGTLTQETPSRDNPTRALWLGGVPQSTTPSTLKRLFEMYGSVESTRVMTQKGYGFVNYDHVLSAINAKAGMDGRELFPGHGPTRIAFAKDPSNTGTPGGIEVVGVNGATTNLKQALSRSNGPAQAGASEGAALATSSVPKLASLNEIYQDVLSIARDFGASADDLTIIARMLDNAIASVEHTYDIPAVPEASQIRIYDAPRLRDIRKRIDNGMTSPAELEEIAQAMLPEVAELSSDYLGNTVVQKMFEYCSEPTKDAMLREIQPHLAQVGAHKNGTWAAQTIIRVAHTPAQRQMIIDGMRPYGMASFLDQYGNYVMQGCLKFGHPTNDFLFECMMSQLWGLAEARFGARAMRACLESPDASRNQQRMLAAAVALYSHQLATNPNGSLLLTWYLDTASFKNRRKTLAPRLIPHMVELCTHKVAYMTILKLINQKEEPEARQQTLQALFFSQDDTVLEAVLADQACGATFIFKTLTTPFFDDHLRSGAVDNVRRVLEKIKAPPNQAYKRLMDEIGITRGVSAERRANGPSPRKGGRNQQHMNGNAYSPLPQQPYSPAPVNGNYDAYNSNGVHMPAYPSPMTPGQAQPYQQASPYAQQGRYNYMGPGGYPTPMSAAYGPNSGSPQSHMGSNPSPMMPQHGYNPMMAGGAQWQQYGPPPQYAMPAQGMHMQGMMNGAGNGRRGRR